MESSTHAEGSARDVGGISRTSDPSQNDTNAPIVGYAVGVRHSDGRIEFVSAYGTLREKSEPLSKADAEARLGRFKQKIEGLELLPVPKPTKAPKAPEPKTELILHLSRSEGPVTNTKLEPWDITLSELAKAFSEPSVGPKDGTYIVRGPSNSGNRNDASVTSGEVLVIDGDQSIDLATGEICERTSVPPESVHKALRKLGIAHVTVTTHSNSPSTGVHKHRTFIPCPIANSDQLHAMNDWLVKKLHDQRCGVKLVLEMDKFSQPWFEPRIPNQDALEHFRLFTHLDGQVITAETVREVTQEWLAKPENNSSKAPSERSADYDGESVIGRFNAMHDSLDDFSKLLEDHGCIFERTDRVNGHPAVRYLPPGSTSGVAGLHVFRSRNDDRYFISSHNASFPLSASAVDYFELYCHLEHDGDKKKAVKAISDLVDDDEPDEADIDGDAFDFDIDIKTIRGFTTRELKPVEFAIDGFIATGITLISGSAGVGKTSSLVPLACMVAHLTTGANMEAELRRKVVYVCEDPGQVERTLYGLRRRSTSKSPEEFAEWFHIVPATRKNPKTLGKAVAKWRKEYAYDGGEGLNNFMIEPLIVLDTSNATIDLANENDNAEVGKFIAAIKEVLGNASLWLIAHMPKNASRSDIKDMSARGASAFAGDANATAFLISEDAFPDRRFLILQKRRFEAEFTEVEIQSYVDFEIVETPWGTTQKVDYRWGVPKALGPGCGLKAQKEEIRTQKELEHDVITKADIVDFLGKAVVDHPDGVSMNTITGSVKGKKERLKVLVSDLIEEGVIDRIQLKNHSTAPKLHRLKNRGDFESQKES